ncbi:plasmid recombination protein, partial [Bacillus pumilus]|uniref:plasmid recombination protein n=1 Tax=Bacillus pumilus TaxID=1408 RepID=UPI00164322F9
KSPDFKGQHIHNHTQKHTHTNPHIHPNPPHLNYHLFHDKPLHYNPIINQHIQNNLHTKPPIPKHPLTSSSFIISPTPQFFQNLSPHSETQFFKSNLQFIQERY